MLKVQEQSRAHLGVEQSLCSRCVFLSTAGCVTPGHRRSAQQQKQVIHVALEHDKSGNLLLLLSVMLKMWCSEIRSYTHTGKKMISCLNIHRFDFSKSHRGRRADGWKLYLCDPRKQKAEDPPNDLIELINNDKTSNQHAGFLKALVRS